MTLDKTDILKFIQVVKKHNLDWINGCSHCSVFNGECNNLASQGRCKAWEGISCKNKALKELGVTKE